MFYPLDPTKAIDWNCQETEPHFPHTWDDLQYVYRCDGSGETPERLDRKRQVALVFAAAGVALFVFIAVRILAELVAAFR
jgi:hypothetical protein